MILLLQCVAYNPRKNVHARLTCGVFRVILNRMVNNQARQLNRVFGALADPTRRAILERLTRGDETVTALAAPFASSLPAISKHLRVLENAGLIVRRSSGRRRICRIEPSAMTGAAEWIDYYRTFWTERLDALEAMLNSDEENGR
jgi:DNA-binding transcriptional ArsR family regulator